MKFELVPNSPAYHDFIRRLRNDDRVQTGFLEQVSITPEQQQAYMDKYGDRYFVALVEGQPAGYIGEVDNDIRIATHPDFQRRGVARRMLREFMTLCPQARARVKWDNESSLRLFRSAGFKEDLIVFRPPSPRESAPERQSPESGEEIEISAVSPVYLGAVMVDELVERLSTSLARVSPNYEIILVEDGSPDSSWPAIQAACRANPRVKGIRLSRNFGQHYAISAGLAHARGEWVTVLDCDLQDRPEEVPRLHQAAVEGNFDLVLARREIRQDRFLRRLSSRAFYAVFSYLTETVQDSAIANFGIYRRKVIDSVLRMGDSIRYFPTMSQWVGFQRGYLDVEHAPRRAGESSYNWKGLLRLASQSIIAFSSKPLRLTLALGALICVVSFLVSVYYIGLYLMGKIVVLGYTSLILSIWFIGGMIIGLIGMLGIYISSIFNQVKQRPAYIVAEALNLESRTL